MKKHDTKKIEISRGSLGKCTRRVELVLPSYPGGLLRHAILFSLRCIHTIQRITSLKRRAEGRGQVPLQVHDESRDLIQLWAHNYDYFGWERRNLSPI